jgi:hypothetical protein
MRPLYISVITVTITLAGIPRVTDFSVFCPKTVTCIIFYTQTKCIPFNVRVNDQGLFHLETPYKETRRHFLAYLFS